ncbi:hypothetical protein BpHYR1_050742 [Brachionus plicatilis]|uniref:Uncharacterized protein n=1 Tax=Brachionus plicatilis TaxID=10195 RepID=A0A3M7RJA8_BRAPC|nr:hypothetical protein BpHYR1_050742 [Brachionus plicatilis]
MVRYRMPTMKSIKPIPNSSKLLTVIRYDVILMDLFTWVSNSFMQKVLIIKLCNERTNLFLHYDFPSINLTKKKSSIKKSKHLLEKKEIIKSICKDLKALIFTLFKYEVNHHHI